MCNPQLPDKDAIVVVPEEEVSRRHLILEELKRLDELYKTLAYLKAFLLKQ